MKGIKQYYKDVIEKYDLNPPKEVKDFAYSDEIRIAFFEKELEKVIDTMYNVWKIEVSYHDVINSGGSDNIVIVRTYFSVLMRSFIKNGRKKYSYSKIGLFLDKKPHTIMHYCRKLYDNKEKLLFNIFYKQYKLEK